MQFSLVRYEELRTFGSYQNQTIGLGVILDDGDDPDEALTKARDWVRGKLDQEATERYDTDAMIRREQTAAHDLARLEEQIEIARDKWQRVQAFLKRHGLNPANFEDVPF